MYCYLEQHAIKIDKILAAVAMNKQKASYSKRCCFTKLSGYFTTFLHNKLNVCPSTPHSVSWTNSDSTEAANTKVQLKNKTHYKH